MNKLDGVLSGLGISKVRLAKYLGVSRQMVYNYLEMDDIDKWPKEKKIKLFTLLNIKTAADLKKTKYDADYIIEVESRLNQGVKASSEDSMLDFKGFNKKENEALSNIIYLLKEKLADGDKEEALISLRYFYHFLQAMDSSPDLKYMLAYVSKAAGYTKALKFEYNKEEQFAFESILFSALTLYTNGGASATRLADSHKKFVQKIEQKNEEKLSRTQELNSVKVQALRELSYGEITEHNAKEVFEKMAEIQSRNV